MGGGSVLPEQLHLCLHLRIVLLLVVLERAERLLLCRTRRRHMRALAGEGGACACKALGGAESWCGAGRAARLRGVQVVGVIEQSLDAYEQMLDRERGLPPLVSIEERKADLSGRVDVRVEERFAIDELELAQRRLIRVVLGECPAGGCPPSECAASASVDNGSPRTWSSGLVRPPTGCHPCRE